MTMATIAATIATMPTISMAAQPPDDSNRSMDMHASLYATKATSTLSQLTA
jgi:hypothetical protein